MKLRETIHHGEYWNRRLLILDNDDPRDALTRAGESSPYAFAFDPDQNRFHQEALNVFEDTGRCEIGWARYEVIT
jgi:hypothetical protein